MTYMIQGRLGTAPTLTLHPMATTAPATTASTTGPLREEDLIVSHGRQILNIAVDYRLKGKRFKHKRLGGVGEYEKLRSKLTTPVIYFSKCPVHR
jgi:hypothetical protein